MTKEEARELFEHLKDVLDNKYTITGGESDPVFQEKMNRIIGYMEAATVVGKWMQEKIRK